jgi:NTE family protein
MSGGGFRATLFHVGSLRRLNELGFLPQLSMITSVSGGSITSGVLAIGWQRLKFDPATAVATNFTDVVEKPLREFCTLDIDVLAGLKGLLPGKSGADATASVYDKRLFSGAKLTDLPAGPGIPTFLFYATSLQTGASVRMTRDYLTDWKVGRLRSPPITLATAVAASSAFPPILSPMIIKTDPAKWEDMPGTLFFNEPKYRSTLILSDGGVYDNLGLEAIASRLDTVLVSDAGAPLTPSAEESSEWAHMTARVFDCVTDQARALRKRNLIADFKAGAAKGTYWGITTHIDDYHLSNTMTKDNEITSALKAMRTRLNKFNDQEQGRLINWGYALADAAMRRHMLNGGEPGTWPDPKYAL